MRSETIVIINKLGIHARAAAKLVNLSHRFSSQIEIEKENTKVSAKSIMGLMMLAASQGSTLTLMIEGEDENEAFIAIQTLIANKFEELE